MVQILERRLHSRTTVHAACAVSLALGLFFVFVWAPHPWGWNGFDHYHELALALARGEPFPTMEVPWGYAYFLAGFYRVFGDRPWIPLVAQVALNATVPWLTFLFARTWTDNRTAVTAALLTGALSFNTVYASTQSSDAVCTVIYMTALVTFTVALRRDDWRAFALVGLLSGLAPQFRPNVVLVPLLLAGYAVWDRWSWRRAGGAATLLAVAGLTLTPWVVRNYRLTHTVLPTSVHGGVQLWYGTLQVGPYLKSRAYNPRAIFESPVFDYTSLDDVPLVVTAQPKACPPGLPEQAFLTYWTERDATPRPITARATEDGPLTFSIPAPGEPTVLYYYLTASWNRPQGRLTGTTPLEGAAAPFVYFVSGDHLGDLDRRGDLLDIFDLIRLMRHTAWSEPLPFSRELAAAGIGQEDVGRAAELLGAPFGRHGSHASASLSHDEGRATLTLGDGSTIVVPRAWSGRITDVAFDGALATGLMTSRVPLTQLARAGTAPPLPPEAGCAELEEVSVNGVFYRREPHLMRRYSALAFDNIRRAPLAFLAAAAYRAGRLFIIQGTDDHHTAQQFNRSGLIYALAAIASDAYLLLLIAGVIIVWRGRSNVMLPLLLILYIPATIAPVLTNMRYSITVQPIEFVFISSALLWLASRAETEAVRWAARGRADSRTAPRP